MKQVKNKRNLLIVCVLLLTLCLAGCGLFKSDTQKLKDLLEDKYGEKFGVESYYYAGDMWSMCYPLSDPTLLFEVRTDDKVTFIGHDYYLQTVVQRQVDEELQPLVEQAFPGSFVSSYIGNTLKTIPETFPRANEVGINDIIEYCTQTGTSLDIVINIFVDTSQMTEESSEEEYLFIVEEIGERVAGGELPDTIVKLYFGDAIFINECKEILASEKWYGNSTIYEMIDGRGRIRIYLFEEQYPMSGPTEYGGTEYTLENYYKERMEAINNE